MNITSNYGVQATGKVKLVSIVSGTLFLMVIPVTYIFFKLDYPFWVPFAYNVIAVVICPIVGGITLQKNIREYSILRMMIPDLLRGWISLLFVFSVTYFIKSLMEECFIRLVLVCIVSTALVGIATYYIVFPKERRQVINQLIKNKIWKRNR